VNTVTCRTEGCENNGIGIEMALDYTDPDTGEQVHISAVVCGPCGQPITDISEGGGDAS
jgi:hypothetical protein